MFRVVAIFAGALLIAGCSDDASTPIDVGPTGPSAIELVEPASSESPVCVSLGDNGADVAIPMLVQLTELELRQPGGCGNFAQCGHLALFVGDLLNNESAVPSIELLTRKLGNPFHDGSIHPNGAPDYLHVRVEMIGEDGLTLLDHDELPLADDIDLITVVDCSAL